MILTCMCDIRIASDQARFGETFVSGGPHPRRWRRLFSCRGSSATPRPWNWRFTCRVIDAAEALRLGLVSEVVAPDKLMERSLEIAAEIARHPGRILRLAKRLFSLVQGKSLEETLDISAAFQALCHNTPEHMQALEAFFARQKERSSR